MYSRSGNLHVNETYCINYSSHIYSVLSGGKIPQCLFMKSEMCADLWKIFLLFRIASVFRTEEDAGGAKRSCQEQHAAGAASLWGHISVLCSLSGNILIWSLCFYKTGQDLLYPQAICVSACTEIVVVKKKWWVNQKELSKLKLCVWSFFQSCTVWLGGYILFMPH